jgi:eukaryotic-like serine/threonine-protein kinase
MTPERWQQIDRLFHATLAREPIERVGFLAVACAGDESLRCEVESLMTFHYQAQSFIEMPPGDVAAELLGCFKGKFRAGQQIDNYRIMGQLGAGGMGEVYLAEDTKLNRKIALKLLPAHFTVSAQHVSRFHQEARTASALNHPNIVTIYEICQSNSTHFIATEFINGVTLREHLIGANMRLAEVLDVVGQIASALTAAHEAGIVHRDIKPENIMLRGDGLIKVLDFGLAKLAPNNATSGSQTSPNATFNTDPEIVMGTVQYMSPEQARGEHMDHRTDIWSLGVVLYEMLSGHVPFVGETSSHVIVSILEAEPLPIRRYVEIPVELERIIIKTLSKTRDERYQTAADLMLDLKNVGRGLEVDARVKRVTPLNDNGSQKRWTTTSLVSTANFVLPSWTKRLVGEIKHHQIRTVVFSLILLLVASLAYFSLNRTKTSKYGTTNEEAYRHYLHGMNLAGNRSPEDALEAANSLHEAVKLDPNYALAWAGLAFVYRPLGSGDSHEAYRKSMAAINKAIALDPNLAETYSSLCENKMYYEYDFAGAEAACKRSIDLKPNSSLAHDIYARFLMSRGRHDEAIAEIKTAIDLEPSSRFSQRNLGIAFFYARRYPEAIVQFKRVVAMDKYFDTAYFWLSTALALQGNESEAFEWVMKLWSLRKVDEGTMEAYRIAFRTSGWLGVLGERVKQVDKAGEGYFDSAAYSAQIGNKDKAFDYLNKVYQDRKMWMAYLQVDPRFDALRDDARFHELVRRVESKR